MKTLRTRDLVAVIIVMLACCGVITASDVISADSCPQAFCLMECPQGFEIDEKGCKLCQCKSSQVPPACPKIACVSICENGYKLDAKGCQTCDCLKLPTTPPVPCPAIECPEICPRGYAMDSTGCQTCSCIKPNPSCSPRALCSMYCPHGNMLDQQGCLKCACASQPTPVACPALECAENCPRGYVIDSTGCQTCSCIKPNPSCSPGPLCSMYCPHGNMLDQQGCPRCACASQPVEPPKTEEGCSEAMCKMNCVHGFRVNEKGCPICECASNPCETVRCSQDEHCISETPVTNSSKKPQCVGWHRNWCSRAMCSMYCEHGFVRDVYGCPQCQCLQEPAPKSRPPVTCSNTCLFGHAYNIYGSITCDCLPNSCETKVCPIPGKEVCEVQFDDDTCLMNPYCPPTYQCVGEDTLRVAFINITYQSQSLIVLMNDIKRHMEESLNSLLPFESDQIGCMNITQGSNRRQLVVTFKLFLPKTGSSFSMTQAIQQLKRKILQDDGRQAEVKVHSMTFIPQASTMSVIYYKPKSWIPEEAPVETCSTVTVTAIIVVCVLATTVIATVCIACKRRRNRRRANAIYKPVMDVHM